jgi:hypothetical protein
VTVAGGGAADPIKRDREQVEGDARLELVSEQQAKSVYGRGYN